MYRTLLIGLLSTVAASVTSCGDAGVGKTFPVSGRVTLNGQTFIAKSAVVQFIPNAAKGNNTRFEPTANVDSSGNYALFTKTKKGAPLGWYKVVVTAVEGDSSPASAKKPLTQRPLPKSLVPAKYGLEKTTTLEVEVVENAISGAYDLKLTD